MTTVTDKFTMTFASVDAGSNIVGQPGEPVPIWTGTASSNLDAENVTVTAAPLGRGFEGGGGPEFLAQDSLPFVVLNGVWQTGAAPIVQQGGIGGGDGVYQVTAEIGAPSNPLITVSQDVILAASNTPFSAVGIAFIDLNEGLSQAVYKSAVFKDLTEEQAGLAVLHSYDAFPTKPFQTLTKDIADEIRTLDFKPSLLNEIAAPAVVAKLAADQSAIGAYINHTPALVALLNPGTTGTGW